MSVTTSSEHKRYGAIASPHFRLFEAWQGEGITLSGQAVINTAYRTGNDLINGYLGCDKDWVIASDTDSQYLDFSQFVAKKNPKDPVQFMVQLCDVVMQKRLTETFHEFAESTNAYVNRIDMKREAIGSAIFVAKKNYVMRVYDNEGTRYAQPKTKITGLEAIKSFTPKFFKDRLKKGYELGFQPDEKLMHEFVSKCYEDYLALPIDEFASSTRVNNVDVYLDGDQIRKGTPANSKAAITFNQLIKKHGLTRTYRLIQPGDKIKMVKLKEPNPFRVPSMAYLDACPKEINLEKWVDRDTNFEKYFLKPLHRVIDILGWNHEHVENLDDFF